MTSNTTLSVSRKFAVGQRVRTLSTVYAGPPGRLTKIPSGAEGRVLSVSVCYSTVCHTVKFTLEGVSSFATLNGSILEAH